MKKEPRGIRNNNPGNIRRTGTQWKGMKVASADLEFVEFELPVWGVRAMMKILLTYYNKYDLDTVQSILNRWAPPHENDTGSYARHVAKRLNVRDTDRIDVSNTYMLIGLAQAITIHENGYPPKGEPENWYSDDVYRRAATLAKRG